MFIDINFANHSIMDSNLTISYGLKICCINVEGISKSKSEFLSKFAFDQDVKLLMLQKTHTKTDFDLEKRGLIENFDLISSVNSPVHGIAVYLRSDVADYEILLYNTINVVYIIAVKINMMTYINIYKPPSVNWIDNTLTIFSWGFQ